MLSAPLCRGQEACPSVAVIRPANARGGELLRYLWTVQVYDWIPSFSKCCRLMPQWHSAPRLFYWRAEEQRKHTLDRLVGAARRTPGFMAVCIRFQHVVMPEPCLAASRLCTEHGKQNSRRTGECGSFYKLKVVFTLCPDTGPVRPGVPGRGSRLLGQRGLRSLVGIYGWELVILLCV